MKPKNASTSAQRLCGLLSRFDGELDRMLQAASETTIGRKICCQELTTVLVCKDTNRKVALQMTGDGDCDGTV